MKKSFLIFVILYAQLCYSQGTDSNDVHQVKNMVYQFLFALEKQDTILFKSLLFTNAQVWVVFSRGDSLQTRVRTFKDDYNRFDPNTIIHEVPLRIEVKLHNNIAIAWVPYELSVNDKFSHCGIDTFTFLRTAEGWKIVNLSYSIEPDGCAGIKSSSGLK